ncbi:MAG: 16S rRNA (guanine(527)-N(7))-methyltransferase RsmG [Bryobacteraceae bacterium]
MAFAEHDLQEILPGDLPNRDEVIAKSSRHLELIEEANRQFNLTRITSPREAAIKHVADSLLPWKLFAGAKTVLDIGSGAGFPGIPLAVVFPETQFTLAESIQKKARFLESAIEALQLSNVLVTSQRAEDLLKTERFDILTARAVAPLSRALGTFAPAWKPGVRALFYKGPDAETEIAEATMEARKRQVRMRVAFEYGLPDELGTRSIVELAR